MTSRRIVTTPFLCGHPTHIYLFYFSLQPDSEIGVLATQFEKAFVEQLHRYVPGREYKRMMQTSCVGLDDHAYSTVSKAEANQMDTK